MSVDTNIYVTPEFIRDARCADYTLWVFGGGFTTPSNYQGPQCFSQEWLTDSISLSARYYLTCPGPSQAGTNDGLTLWGLTTCLKEDMTKATVKIYLNTVIASQSIGFLTYSINGFGIDGCGIACERIAFYFCREAYIDNCISTSPFVCSKNNAAYITLDLSALNIAANIKPVYTPVRDCVYGGGFIYDHQHTLKEPDRNSDNALVLDTQNIYANAGTISSCYYDARQNRSVIVERLNKCGCSYLMAADGRITCNDKDHASDYTTDFSYTSIGFNSYGLESQRYMNQCINYNDVIYFEDETSPETPPEETPNNDPENTEGSYQVEGEGDNNGGD